ncbi:hypothetical protein ACS0TY_033842 [Phlomoides rotata]
MLFRFVLNVYIFYFIFTSYQCLPVTIDVGTNNEQLLNDEFYIGLNIKRATGQEYLELLDEFMCAVKQNYGEKVLVQFEMGEDYRQPPTIRRIEGE